jgi:hypothetical protein
MTTRNPLVLDGDGKIVELPTGDVIGGALAGTNGTDGIDGGAITIKYTFDTTTTDADPDSGKLRLNNATQNTATSIYADVLDFLGSDWTSVIDTFDDSSNTVKGSIRLVKSGDASKFLTFNATAVTTATGYRKITVSNTGSSASSPFSHGDTILLCFNRAGDKGADGASGNAWTLVETHTASSSASLEFTSGISGTYDEYELVLLGFVPASTPVDLYMTFSTNGGSSYLSSGYQWITTQRGSDLSNGQVNGCNQSNSDSKIIVNRNNATATWSNGTGQSLNGRMRFYNLNSSSLYKEFEGSIIIKFSGGQRLFMTNGGGVDSATAVNAFKLAASSGNIASGVARLYAR